MNTSTAMDDEIVNFPVPKRLLPVVIQALAKAMEPVAPTRAEAAVTTGYGTGQGMQPNGVASAGIDWTDIKNMEILRKGLKSPIGFKLLDMTAARYGEMVSFKEIYTAAGFTETRPAGSSVGSMTKVIKRDFGVSAKEAFWPVEHHWAVNNDAQYYYRMSREVAQAWQQSAV